MQFARVIGYKPPKNWSPMRVITEDILQLHAVSQAM